ncbi:MAG TPA: response regulator [Anaeromyxobacter sp.]|nr:response regulator [Anaeromyxobacter sp.]
MYPETRPGNDLVSSTVSAGTARLLVCDDSASMRALLKSILQPHYEVHLTATAEEALADAPRFAPDVILSDLLLPGMSGSELCRAIRTLPAMNGVPFVLVTTFGGPDARADGLEAGADDYLVKPIRPRELLARVASLVRLRRVLVALEERSHELERANLALRDTRDQLVRAEKLAAVGSLAAGLAHEINNPLAYIKAGSIQLLGFVDELHRMAESALSAGLEAGEVQALCGRIRETYAEASDVAQALSDGSRRLERLASDLRVVSTPASGAQELVEPSDTIDAAWTVLRSRYTALPRFEVQAEPGPPIQSSHALLTQAILPVLERAVVMAGAEGSIAVHLDQIPGGVEIRVRDSGPGIPPEVIPRIFDPFFTARPATSAGGLGLSVAYGIAHGLGGDITVSSPAGEGATFRMRLPRIPGGFVPAMKGGR